MRFLFLKSSEKQKTVTFLAPTLNLWQSFSASSTVKRWLVQLTRPDVDYLQYAVNANVCSLLNSWNSQFYPFSQILILNNIITNTHFYIWSEFKTNKELGWRCRCSRKRDRRTLFHLVSKDRIYKETQRKQTARVD